MMGRNRSKNEERAEDERFTCTVNGDGTVTVQNDTHPDPSNHRYEVTLGDGFVTDCSCPHRQHRGERCKHMHKVSNDLRAVLPANYGVDDTGTVDEPDDASVRTGADDLDLSLADVRDVRQALATEVADAHEAGRTDEADRLSDLRARFADAEN